MEHYRQADVWIKAAEAEVFSRETKKVTRGAATIASLATAHAVLALLDYLQQDDEPEPAAYRKDRENLVHIIEARDTQIRDLNEALAGAYAALRVREEADAAEMKERQESRRCLSKSPANHVLCDRWNGHAGEHRGFDDQDLMYRWPNAS